MLPILVLKLRLVDKGEYHRPKGFFGKHTVKPVNITLVKVDRRGCEICIKVLVNVFIRTVRYAAGFDLLPPHPDSRLSILEKSQPARNNAVRAFGRNAHSLAVYYALPKWTPVIDHQQLRSFGRFD